MAKKDSKKAGDLAFSMNLITPDNGEKFAIELSNSTMTNVEGFVHENPDLQIVINRSDLEKIMMGQKSFAAAIEDGTAKVEGDVGLIAQLAQTLVTFEIGFEILPGTGARALEVDLNPYEVPTQTSNIRGE